VLKKAFCVISAILLLTNCVSKTTTATSATGKPASEITQPILEDNNSKATAEESAPLIIGGRQYRGQLGEMVEVEKGSWRIPGEPVYCTVDDIDKILIVLLWINPEDPESRNSLENIDLLYNLKELYIDGENLDKVDFSPISSLYNLEELVIDGNITRLPDLTSLERLNKIDIKKAALESLEGIGAPNVKRIEIEAVNGNIDSLAPLNNMLMLEAIYITCLSDKVLKIADMANMPSLKVLNFSGGKIDMHGIERLASLEDLVIYDCEPFNFEGIGRLNNLRGLMLNLISDNPSIDFLRGMPNIIYLDLFGHYSGLNDRYQNRYQKVEVFQVLDASPLATATALNELSFNNLIIKNISSLDVLNGISGGIRFEESRLYDENDKTRHGLNFGIRH